jgi:hypothetical protein
MMERKEDYSPNIIVLFLALPHSTIMERFLNAVLNIIQQGTGTRCPLDTTCIHDDRCIEPKCELSGSELDSEKCGKNLKVSEVFQRITEHNRALGREDRFSTESLRLVFRSKSVQNMRFVDTPGIISNLGTGKDNREDIARILRSEMSKANTKLCILLEPKEFATNPIVDFCDKSFGGRQSWIDRATFVMTKFDKQTGDLESASKANSFFKEFHDNKCFPHLVITPTLQKEDLLAEELYAKRKVLLEGADAEEKDKFADWRKKQDLFRQSIGEDKEDELDEEVDKRVGFESAKDVMRKIMIADTISRLKDVSDMVRMDLTEREKKMKSLIEKQRYNNPSETKLIVQQLLGAFESKILQYLKGSLEATKKFPTMMMSLKDEIEEESRSDWADKDLGGFTDKEDDWRERIKSFDGAYPEGIQADSKFLGGKQYQRAVEFFRSVMIDALPDPYELREEVANCTGYMCDSLQRENWENAMVQITKYCVKDVSHPGINYLIKHVGTIFRRLFIVAMEDIKTGNTLSSVFKLLPYSIEKHLEQKFDEMLWSLMETAADKTHYALEPMYSTVDPDLPTFNPCPFDDESWKTELDRDGADKDASTPGSLERFRTSIMTDISNKVEALMSKSGDAIKSHLKAENTKRATKKKFFLSDERTSMLTPEETEKILKRAFEYIVALMDFNLVILKFQLNHYLYEGFKVALTSSFTRNLVHEADWDSLVEPDEGIEQELQKLKKEIDGLRVAFNELSLVYRKL